MMVLCSAWAVIFVRELIPVKQIKEVIGMGNVRRLKSEYFIVDYTLFLIHKVINCPMCLSYHMFWFVYILLFGSCFGFILGAIPYFLTYYLEKSLTISI